MAGLRHIVHHLIWPYGACRSGPVNSIVRQHSPCRESANRLRFLDRKTERASKILYGVIRRLNAAHSANNGAYTA